MLFGSAKGGFDMRFYIDPGTGSMLFTILIGVLSAGIYALRNSLIKLRFFFSGGRQQKKQKESSPFVIFSDNKRYWNVFEPVCREFENRGVPLICSAQIFCSQPHLGWMFSNGNDPGMLNGMYIFLMLPVT